MYMSYPCDAYMVWFMLWMASIFNSQMASSWILKLHVSQNLAKSMTSLGSCVAISSQTSTYPGKIKTTCISTHEQLSGLRNKPE